MDTILSRTRAILPMLRAVAATDTGDPRLTLALRRRAGKHGTRYAVVATVWELNGYGERMNPEAVAIVAQWSTATADLFIDDGERMPAGPNDHARNAARAAREPLDTIARYAAMVGRAANVHDVPGTVRPRHYSLRPSA
jgi:hypothetical protein